MILTSDKMNWSHFGTRTRYEKNEAGVVIGKHYDRLLIGLRPVGRDWLANKYSGDSPVLCFMLGDKNIVFTHREGDSRIYTNSKAGTQACEYIKFYIREYTNKTGIELEQVQVDDLPTQVVTRNTGAGTTLESAIANAMSRVADIDL